MRGSLTTSKPSLPENLVLIAMNILLVAAVVTQLFKLAQTGKNT